MVWRINEPVELEADSIVRTRPRRYVHYITHNNYDVKKPFNSVLFWQEMERAHKQVAEVWRGIAGWRFSGACAIDWHTKQATRWHTNMDIALLRQREPFNEMTKRMTEAGYYLFERKVDCGMPHTVKIAPHTKLMRLDYVHPEVGILDCDRNRNFVFIRRDSKTGRLQYQDSIESRINLFFHHEEEDNLVCSEDGFTCNPVEFTSIDYKLPEGAIIPLMSQTYLFRRKSQLVRGKEYKHSDPSKHHQDLLKLQ